MLTLFVAERTLLASTPALELAEDLWPLLAKLYTILIVNDINRFTRVWHIHVRS